MNRVAVRRPSFVSLGGVQKGHIVGRRGISMYVLQTHVHWAHSDVQILEPGKEVEEVVRSQGQFRWFQGRRCEGQRRERQSGSPHARGGGRRGHGGGGGRRDGLALAMAGRLPLQLEGICECFFVSPYKVG